MESVDSLIIEAGYCAVRNECPIIKNCLFSCHLNLGWDYLVVIPNNLNFDTLHCFFAATEDCILLPLTGSASQMTLTILALVMCILYTIFVVGCVELARRGMSNPERPTPMVIVKEGSFNKAIH